MIEIKKLNKHFGKLHVLNDINLHFKPGDCIALLGPNGSGKTTLVKSLLGMVLPDSGSIKVMGEDIKGRWEYRSDIGYMPQIGRYPDNMSIGQVFDLMKDIRHSENSILDEDLITSLNLSAMMDKKMRTLSGGTRQKVSAALAFLFNPEILFLDEPTAGLDPGATLILKNKILTGKDQGKLIVITSHVLSELDDLVNKIVFIQDGSVAFNDTWETLQEQTNKETLTEAIAAIMNYSYVENN